MTKVLRKSCNQKPLLHKKILETIENESYFILINCEVSYLSETLGKLEESIDAQQQYSRRNCLLLHGIEETKGEDTDDLVLEVRNDDMGLNISKTALDRSHRIGKPKTKKKVTTNHR